MAKGKKTGGREKGTLNLVRKTAGEIMVITGTNELQSGRVEEAFTELYNTDKRMYLMVLEKYLSYITPKQLTVHTPPDERQEIIIMRGEESLSLCK